METKPNDKKKKKGLLGAIWESMTKTGGSCGGPGESCCGPADTNKGGEKTKEKKDDRGAGERNES